jgi:hypothetical protein
VSILINGTIENFCGPVDDLWRAVEHCLQRCDTTNNTPNKLSSALVHQFVKQRGGEMDQLLMVSLVANTTQQFGKQRLEQHLRAGKALGIVVFCHRKKVWTTGELFGTPPLGVSLEEYLFTNMLPLTELALNWVRAMDRSAFNRLIRLMAKRAGIELPKHSAT